MIPYYDPPETASTKVKMEIRRRFTDGNANVNSVLLGEIRPPESIRFIQVLPDWKGTSFKTLAKQEPDKLIALVENGKLAEHDLTFAAEALGLIEGPPLALLGTLARHSSALVREGAVYGLARHRSSLLAQVPLERLAKSDPSPGVREAATEALDP